MLPRFAPTAASSGGWRGLSGFQYGEFPTLRPAKPSGTHKACCAKNGAPGVKEIEEESPPSKIEDGAPQIFLAAYVRATRPFGKGGGGLKCPKVLGGLRFGPGPPFADTEKTLDHRRSSLGAKELFRRQGQVITCLDLKPAKRGQVPDRVGNLCKLKRRLSALFPVKYRV